MNRVLSLPVLGAVVWAATVGVASPAEAAPPTPVVSASEIDALLLGVAEANAAADATALRPEADPTHSTSDASVISPPDCRGVIDGGQVEVYNTTQFLALRDQGFLQRDPYNPVSGEPTRVDRTVVVYPTAERAQAVLTASVERWNSCAKSGFLQRAPQIGPGAVHWTVGSPRFDGEIVTTSMLEDVTGKQTACGHGLGVRANVVAEAITCFPPYPGANPGDKSAMLVTAILGRVQPWSSRLM